MIAVIADDFTGAAEIGGVAIRNGFSAKIYTELPDKCTSEIIIIATNTRALVPNEAIAITEQITSELLKLNPEFIYKKTDSLLRGNAEEELLAQMKVSGKKRSILIPANPSLNRTIKEGIYYIKDKPIGELASFSENLQKASSAVLDLLHQKNKTKLYSEEKECKKGLFIGNTPDSNSLADWVQKIDAETVPAGGADFFNALIRNRKPEKPFLKPPERPVEKSLYLCGSKFKESIQRVKKAQKERNCVAYMPEDFFCPKKSSLQEKWGKETLKILDDSNTAIVAVQQLKCTPEDLAIKIEKAFADLTEEVLKNSSISHLYIEGGATTFAIIQKLKTTSFTPVEEIERGVIKLQVETPRKLTLTLKPGSYTWPHKIWPF